MLSRVLPRHTRISILLGAGLIAALFGLLSMTETATAAPNRGFEALMVTTPSAAQLTLRPGERKEIAVEFLNIGEKAWVNDGVGYVSLYTYDPKYRRSVFDPGTWLGPTQVKRLIEPRVEVGEVGTMRFELHAPKEEGEYLEAFHLAAEDTAWIPGGQFVLEIRVTKEDTGDSGMGEKSYSGRVVQSTAQEGIVAAGGIPLTVTVGLKNVGEATWSDQEIILLSGGEEATDISWPASGVAARIRDGAVAPGELGIFTFRFLSPRTVGAHELLFAVRADGELVDGSEIRIPMTVTRAAQGEFVPPFTSGIADRKPVMEEPDIRVGVLIVDEETNNQVVVSCDCERMRLTDELGTPLTPDVPRTATATAFYKDGSYFFDTGRGLEQASSPIRFLPSEENAVMTITNFDRRITRGTSYANNRFRHVLELRYNASKDRTWLINELPVERYLRGLAETSNNTHMEFQKALVTAARTYSQTHLENPSKHREEGFHVDAYQDQVYWGYDQEERMPNLVRAIDDTYGVVVTYQGQTAITPYFSRSDGRTRAWAEVWAGSKPWLQSVSVPCDAGKALWGHGVGMSASGGICEAKNGAGWQDILTHYYQGIELLRYWKPPLSTDPLPPGA